MKIKLSLHLLMLSVPDSQFLTNPISSNVENFRQSDKLVLSELKKGSLISFEIQWGSEIWNCLDFKWLKLD